MGRGHDGDGRLAEKAALAARLRAIREEIHGDWGAAELAHRLGIPEATWLNYERGVTIPGEVMLRLLEVSGVEPRWLLAGEGPKYRAIPDPVIPRERIGRGRWDGQGLTRN